MMFEVFALFIQKGVMLPDQVQLLMKMQGYKLPEKRVEQLKRAEARKLKEEQLKLENQIAEAEDAVELAKTKVQFYEELEDPLGGSISRANSVQDLNCEEPLKNIEPKRIIKESMERDRKLEISEHKP